MNDYQTVTARVTSVSHQGRTGSMAVAGEPPVSEQDFGEYGLKLFREGRAREAMPLLEHAARGGDARAQYVCATALFNGDHLPCDVPRAFALMQQASDAGLPQAVESLAQMQAIRDSAAVAMAGFPAVVAAPDAPSLGLLSDVAIAQCRNLMSGVAPRAVVPGMRNDTLGGIVQGLLEVELRDRLETLLPVALGAAVARMSAVADR